MFASEDNEISVLVSSLSHAQSWFELHASQRQNLLNFFLIAVAFLMNAYVAAIAAHKEFLAATVGFLGAGVSLAFTALDFRNRDLTRVGEKSMKEIEGTIADRFGISALRIVEAAEVPRHSWLSMGKLIRAVHMMCAAAFLAAAIYEAGG